MLRHLHISNLALIDETALDFSGGMTALTGETGAGKSIILDAIALLAGTRATPSLVRSGEERATVEAAFDAPADKGFAALLHDIGVEVEDGEVLLRREVNSGGRSRAWVNGRLVPVSQLQQVSAQLFEMNGQHDQQTLLEAGAQRTFFDDFAGLGALRGGVRKAYENLLRAQAELDGLSQEDRQREQRRDFIRFQVEELDAAALAPGELAGMETERARLDHVDAILQEGNSAAQALADGQPGESCAVELLGSALSSLARVAEHDPALKAIAATLEDAQARVSDAAYELARHLDRLEADPDRLGEINDRINVIRRALRKHGPAEADAIARLETLRAELEKLENLDGAREAAAAELGRARGVLVEAARTLTAARERARAGFVRPFTALLKEFSMPKVRMEVRLDAVSVGADLGDGKLCGADGAEEVDIYFSSNEGEGMQPLRRIASGGELSRVMLALRTLIAQKSGAPLLIFDEVDAGISGTAARRVAERLASLGERCQLLCVTHNPSIAAAAAQHFVVEKRVQKGRTISICRPVAGIKREEELARLLDGGQQSAKGIALAAQMLEAG
ncbi:DNA repair protein RecN [soil metagenome]